MDETPPDILVLDRKVDPAELARLTAAFFEYTSLINIRPAQGNRGMEIMDPAIRDRVRELTLPWSERENRFREPTCIAFARALGELQPRPTDPDDRQ